MNFFKRALKYCWRQRLCSVLLLLTFTLLSATVLIAISSEKAVQQGTKQIKETVGASVRIELDTRIGKLRFGRGFWERRLWIYL